jgi:hypothetical protein
MIIANYIEKIKRVSHKAIYFLAQKETMVSLVLIVTGISSFALGFFAGKDSIGSTPKIIFTDVPRESILAASAMASDVKPNETTHSNSATAKSTIFGSKSGTKYYYSWCKAGNRVKLENRIYFESTKQAEAAGRLRAASCK